ncbi:Cytochrome b5 isoform E [Coemansia sp. RSA 532]|nr:Cytochrome b5 isoform E [Coemansia sp. RSA 532]
MSEAKSENKGEVSTFTAAEIAKHNTREDVWILIHDKVYDVTKFLDEHPGGEEVILENAGKDSTSDFEDIGHSEDARDMLSQYYIGDLEASAWRLYLAAEQETFAGVRPSAATGGEDGDHSHLRSKQNK